MNEQNRINMIEQQIRPWEVLDESVLELYHTVLREDFVGEPAWRDLAYADVPLPIGHGQHMLEPKQEARMLQVLALSAEERVLHIGTGSGFFAALLGRLAGEVVSVEIIPELAAAASRRLAAVSPQVKVAVGDGACGWPDGMFDAVVLTGATPVISGKFWPSLKTGGRLLAVEGRPPLMTLTLIEKRAADVLVRRDILETCVPLLQNAPAPPAFAF